MSSFPFGYLRTFCPRKSKPFSTCVMTVFVGESSSPRSCRNCSTRDLTSPSSNSFDLPVMTIGVFRDRARWFEKMDKPHYCLWWVPAGIIFRHSSNGKNLAAVRVGQQALQGSHLAPSAFLCCLRDTHLESANVAVNGLPVNGVPLRRFA